MYGKKQTPQRLTLRETSLVISIQRREISEGCQTSSLFPPFSFPVRMENYVKEKHFDLLVGAGGHDQGPDGGIIGLPTSGLTAVISIEGRAPET